MSKIALLLRQPESDEHDPGLPLRVKRTRESLLEVINNKDIAHTGVTEFRTGESVVQWLESERANLKEIVLICGHKFEDGMDDVGLATLLKERKLLPAALIFCSPQAQYSILRAPAEVKWVSNTTLHKLKSVLQGTLAGIRRKQMGRSAEVGAPSVGDPA